MSAFFKNLAKQRHFCNGSLGRIFAKEIRMASFSAGSTAVGLKNELIETFLNLEMLDVNLFRAKHLMGGRATSMTVYGGQVIGQAMIAASKTVPDEYHPHSLHSYFIKAGDTRKAIVYYVDRVRDGKSFCTRYVKAVQEGITIFTSELSYHKLEADSIVHQSSMPDVKSPEELDEADVLIKKHIDSGNLAAEQKEFLERRLVDLPSTFKIKPVDPMAYLRLKPTNPKYYMWVKSNGKIGDDVRLHHCVAAYISDSSMVGTSLLPHSAAGFRLGMALSLDHSIWIHRFKFAIDDWMLYETESPIAAAGRSLIFGKLWSRDGVLVLSTAQEALIRAKLS